MCTSFEVNKLLKTVIFPIGVKNLGVQTPISLLISAYFVSILFSVISSSLLHWTIFQGRQILKSKWGFYPWYDVSVSFGNENENENVFY